MSGVVGHVQHRCRSSVVFVLVLSLLGAVIGAVVSGAGSGVSAAPLYDAPHTPQVLFGGSAYDRSAVSFDGHHAVFATDPVEAPVPDTGITAASKIHVIDDTSPTPRLVSPYPEPNAEYTHVFQPATDASAGTVVAGYRTYNYEEAKVQQNCLQSPVICPWASEQILLWRGGAFYVVSQSVNSGPPGWPASNPSQTGESSDPSVAADGSRVVFSSGATDLVSAPDNNAETDVFFRDMSNPGSPGPTKLVSRNTDLSPITDAHSVEGRISKDGMHVVFTRRWPGFWGHDRDDVYVADLNANGDVVAVELVSQSSNNDAAVGLPGTEPVSFHPSISEDGRYVSFVSNAVNLVGNPGADSGDFHVYVRDRQAAPPDCQSPPCPKTYLAFTGTGDTAWPSGESPFDAAWPKLSPDGRWLLSSRGPSPVADVLNLPNFSNMGGSSLFSGVIGVFDLSNPDRGDPPAKEKVGLPEGLSFELSVTNVTNSKGVEGAIAVFTAKDHSSRDAVWVMTSDDALFGSGSDFALHADPVDAFNGRFVQDPVDLAAPPGVPAVMTVSRFSNSFDRAKASFGPAWRASWDAGLSYLPDGSLLFVDPQGRRTVFAFQGRTNGDPVWKAPPEFSGAIAWSTSGNRFEITYWSGENWAFDVDGVLKSIDTGSAGSVTIDRDDPNLMMTLAHSSGYTLQVSSYGGTEALGYEDADTTKVGRVRACSVVASCTDERIVDYSYKPDGVDGAIFTLDRVSHPHRTGEADVGFVQYDTADSYITEVKESLEWTTLPDPPANPGVARTRRVVANTFDNLGRVTEQTNGDGDISAFRFGEKADGTPAALYTTVIDKKSPSDAGEKTEYQFNERGQVIGRKDAAGYPSSSTWADRREDTSVSRGGATVKTMRDCAGRQIGVVYPNAATGALPAGLDPANVATWDDDGASYTHTTYLQTLSSEDCDNIGEIAVDTRVVTQRDRAGVVTTYSYGDPNNPLLPTGTSVPCDPTSIDTTKTCPSDGNSTTYTYGTGTLAGLVTKVKDKDDVVTDTTYNTSGPDVPKVHTVTTHPNGESAEPHLTTTYEYLHPGDQGFPSDPKVALVQEVKPPSGPGETTTTYFDSAGRVLEVADPLVNGTTYLPVRNTYYHTGELNTTTDQAGNTTTYSVGYPSDVGWVENPGVVRTSRVVDPLGRGSLSRFDAFGDLVEQVQGAVPDPAGPGVIGGYTTSYAYGVLGRLEKVTGPPLNGNDPGVSTFFHYDADGRQTMTVTGQSDPNASASDCTQLQTAPLTTCTKYDKVGQVTDIYGPVGDTEGLSHLQDSQAPENNPIVRTHTKFGYDPAGRKVWQLEGADAADGDPAKMLTAFVNDSAGRMFRTIVQRRAYYNTSAPADLDLANSDATGSPLVTETRYSPAGRQAQTILAPVDDLDYRWGDATPAKRVMRTNYDKAGRANQQVDARGKTTTTVYDLNGRVQSVATPLDGSTTYQTSYSYDPAGRLVHITTPSGASSPSAVTVDRAYDPRGLVTSETDPYSGSPTGTRHYQYDEAGQLETVTDANGNDVSYAYDTRGLRTARYSKDDSDLDPCDPLDQTPNLSGCAIEDWIYDPAGNLTRQTLPHANGAATHGTNYQYNGKGQLEVVTDDSGRTSTRAYFNTGALKADIRTQGAQDPESVDCGEPNADTIVGYCYRIDARGRTTATRDVTERTGGADGFITTSYNQTGQPLVVSDVNGTTKHQWDQAANMRQIQYPDGIDFVFVHNANNQLTGTGLPWGSGIWPLAWYALNDAGAPTWEGLNLFALSGNRQYVRDSANHIAGFAESITKPGTPATYDLHYGTLAYRNDGRLATECAGPTQLSGANYQQRQTACLGTLPQDVQRSSYDYDSAGQLCTATNNATPLVCGTTQGATHGYGYDSRGNRTSHYDGTSITRYTYTTASELCAATTHTSALACGAQPPTGATTTTYTYDEMGRRTADTTSDGTTDTRTVQRTYDPAGRAARTDIHDTALGTKHACRYHTASGRIGTYVEDSTDCAETSPETTVTLTWSDVNGIPQLVDGRLNGTAWTRLNYGIERFGADIVGTSTKWYKYDQHGSTTKPAEGNTNSPDAPTGYEPYGKPTDPAFHDNKGFFGYRGELHLDGLIHLRNRDYDPEAGVFLQRDPLDGVDGTTTVANPYHYVDNDPLNKIDPLGERPHDPEDYSGPIIVDKSGAVATFARPNCADQCQAGAQITCPSGYTLFAGAGSGAGSSTVTIQVGEVGMGGIHGLSLKSRVSASRALMSCLRVVER